MGVAGNLAIAVGGALLEAAILIAGATWAERRVRRRRQEQPIRAVATVQRAEVSPPPRKELTR